MGRWPKREELLRNGYTQRRDRVIYNRYRTQREVAKRAVKVAKRMADWRWGEDSGMISRKTKIFFLKEVMRLRKGEQTRDEMVKDVNGQIFRDCEEVRRRWQISMYSWQLADAGVRRFE